MFLDPGGRPRRRRTTSMVEPSPERGLAVGLASGLGLSLSGERGEGREWWREKGWWSLAKTVGGEAAPGWSEGDSWYSPFMVDGRTDFDGGEGEQSDAFKLAEGIERERRGVGERFECKNT